MVAAEAPGLPENIVATLRGTGKTRILMIGHLDTVFGPGTVEDWHVAAPKLGAKDRYGKAALARPLEVDVERERARFGAWYELFPRSFGGFKGVQEVLPQLAELGAMMLCVLDALWR